MRMIASTCERLYLVLPTNLAWIFTQWTFTALWSSVATLHLTGDQQNASLFDTIAVLWTYRYPVSSRGTLGYFCEATPLPRQAFFSAIFVFSACFSPASLLVLARPRALSLPAGGRNYRKRFCWRSSAATKFPYGQPRPIKQLKWSRRSSGVWKPLVIRNRNTITGKQRDGGNRCLSVDRCTFSSNSLSSSSQTTAVKCSLTQKCHGKRLHLQ